MTIFPYFELLFHTFRFFLEIVPNVWKYRLIQHFTFQQKHNFRIWIFLKEKKHFHASKRNFCEGLPLFLGRLPCAPSFYNCTGVLPQTLVISKHLNDPSSSYSAPQTRQTHIHAEQWRFCLTLSCFFMFFGVFSKLCQTFEKNTASPNISRLSKKQTFRIVFNFS